MRWRGSTVSITVTEMIIFWYDPNIVFRQCGKERREITTDSGVKRICWPVATAWRHDLRKETMEKFMTKDRDPGFDSHILKFLARLVDLSSEKVDTKRKFVIFYFLSLCRHYSDQWAPWIEFRKKCRQAILEINNHTCILTAADDYVLQFMEKDSECDKVFFSLTGNIVWCTL